MANNTEKKGSVERLQSFLDWCGNNGIKINPKVKISSSTSHRYGMVALNDIKSNEVLIDIPRKLTLTSSRSSIATRIKEFEEENKEQLKETSGWVPLLIALMYEMKSSTSFWTPYLDLCPSRKEFNQPMFWDEEERHKELAGLSILWDVQRDLFNIEKEYKQFVLPFIEKNQDIMSPESYTLDLFMHMVGFIMSYSFTDGENDETLMVPMADSLNHHSDNNAHLLFDDEDILKMISIKPIKKDEEIFNTFGKLGNSQLLYKYGFVEKDVNSYDTVEIPLVLIVDILEAADVTKLPVLQAMLAYMKKMGIADEEEPLIFCSSGLKAGPDIYAVLRILHMEVKEFIGLLQDHVSWYQDRYFLFLLEHVQEATKKQSYDGEIPTIDISDDDDDEADEVKIVENHEDPSNIQSNENMNKPCQTRCTAKDTGVLESSRQDVVQSADRTIAKNNVKCIDTLQSTSTHDVSGSNENTISEEAKVNLDIQTIETKKHSPNMSDGQKKNKNRKRKQVRLRDKVEDSDEDVETPRYKQQQMKIRRKEEAPSRNESVNMDDREQDESAIKFNKDESVEIGRDMLSPYVKEQKDDEMERIKSKEDGHSEDPDDESDDENSESHLQLTYDQINSILPPSWKKTMRSVVTNAMATMSNDVKAVDGTSMTEHASLAYHVRSGQWKILKMLEQSVTI